MSSINYIKSTLKKLNNDNLLNFLLDIVTCGGIDTVEDYNPNKQYHRNEKVYCQDDDGMHHIYICTVNAAAIGVIHKYEWLDLLQYFRRPNIGSVDVDVEFEMIEEIVVSTTANQKTFTLTTPGVENNLFTIIIYHPVHGRLAKTDFTIQGRNVTLKDEYIVETVGSRLVIDLVKKN